MPVGHIPLGVSREPLRWLASAHCNNSAALPRKLAQRGDKGPCENAPQTRVLAAQCTSQQDLHLTLIIKGTKPHMQIFPVRPINSLCKRGISCSDKAKPAAYNANHSPVSVASTPGLLSVTPAFGLLLDWEYLLFLGFVLRSGKLRLSAAARGCPMASHQRLFAHASSLPLAS